MIIFKMQDDKLYKPEFDSTTQEILNNQPKITIIKDEHDIDVTIINIEDKTNGNMIIPMKNGKIHGVVETKDKNYTFDNGALK